jgi:hypothetical protein
MMSATRSFSPAFALKTHGGMSQRIIQRVMYSTAAGKYANTTSNVRHGSLLCGEQFQNLLTGSGSWIGRPI